MSAFDEARKIEDMEIGTIVDFFARFDEVKTVFPLSYTPQSTTAMLHKQCGDIYVQKKDGVSFTVEAKVDEVGHKTGNFFLEEWSNTDPLTHGWMHYCQAEYLAYYFSQNKMLYVMDFKELRNWAFVTKDEKTNVYGGEMRRYPTRSQEKYVQLNKPQGHIVPIAMLNLKDWCSEYRCKSI